jgi:hypothetical protein
MPVDMQEYALVDDLLCAMMVSRASQRVMGMLPEENMLP